MENLVLISDKEQNLRISKVREAMRQYGIASALISSTTNIYYLTGRVFVGYIYLPVEGAPIYFLKRPTHLAAPLAINIRKPESIISELKVRGLPLPVGLGVELSHLTYADTMRLKAGLKIDDLANVSPCLAQARATKTEYEQNLMRISGAKHEMVYRKIPMLFQPGMTDYELQVEIERLSRLEGCLGQFRISGNEMELFMANILAGDNADAPSPYDFAMGGAGMDPSLPVGANGTILKPGVSVMVDVNGNFNGYMTDMTRTFSVGRLQEFAMYAHQVSIDICRALAEMGKPGVEAKALYEKALEMAKDAGLEDYFMGHRQHAGFVGHGVGIEVNELPVLSPRSKGILEEGNTIAIEPKFVIPGTGAVGIENTYIVKADGMESITRANPEIIDLNK